MSKRHTLGISKWLPSTKDKITFEITLRPSTPDISKHLCCTLWRSTQETCMACEYVWGHHVLWGCVGLPWGLWGCVWLWIVCEDCGACEDNHSLPTNAFAMVSTQRANTVATNNNDNSHNAKYRCNKILNQTDFLKQIMLYQVRHEWWWSVNESIRTAGPCRDMCFLFRNTG